MKAILSSPCGAAIMALSFAFCGTGCVATMPTDRQYAHIIDGTKALVLLRFDVTFDGEPVAVSQKFSVDGSLGTLLTQLGEPVQNPETGFVEFAHFFAAEDGEDGWAFYVLPPGTYYLEVRCHGAPVFEVPENVEDRYEFRIDIPLHTQAVYLGTFTSNLLTGKLFFGRDAAGFETGALKVTNELPLATELTADLFPDLTPPVASIMSRYEGGTREVWTPLESLDGK